MREMVHKVKPDQVYFSMCKVEFLLCSTYKCFCPSCTVLISNRISLQRLYDVLP